MTDTNTEVKPACPVCGSTDITVHGRDGTVRVHLTADPLIVCYGTGQKPKER